MPMGTNQTNNLLHLTLDRWNDKVFLNGTAYPAGHFACEAMNISMDELSQLREVSEQISIHADRLYAADADNLRELLPAMKLLATTFVNELWRHPPYCYFDIEAERHAVEIMFSAESAEAVADPFAQGRAFLFRYISAMLTIPYGLYHFLCGSLPLENDYLRRLKRRDETHFSVATHDYFNSELYRREMPVYNSIPLEPFTETPNMKATFCFARNPKNEKEMVFVERMLFDHVVDFLTYDLFNGMHWGHAPSKCQNCGRYFLTATAHTPKYCNGFAPQNPRYTCRQYGALRSQKEKNEDHPVYALFRTRTNTIRKHHQRGKINGEERAAAIALAEELRDRALLDREYAEKQYQADMEQKNFETELKRRLEG